MSTARLFHESDCNLDYLAGKTVAIIGYGSQGHAHALNLKRIRSSCYRWSLRGRQVLEKGRGSGT